MGSVRFSLLKNHGIKEKSEAVRHIEVRSFEKYQPELTRLVRDAARIGLEHCPKPPGINRH